MEIKHLKERQFIVDGSTSERYGEAVNQTAKLLKRPYFQMHSIFTKEGWSTEEIERAYQNATKHCGQLSPAIAWWANRKRRNGV